MERSLIEFTAATYVALVTALGCGRDANAVLALLASRSDPITAGLIENLVEAVPDCEDVHDGLAA